MEDYSDGTAGKVSLSDGISCVNAVFPADQFEVR